MSTEIGGSISGVPQFPYVQGPSDEVWALINAELSEVDPSLYTAYRDAKIAFDAANILASQQGKDLLEARETLQTVLDNPDSTEQEIQDARDAYQAAFEDFSATMVDFNDKVDALIAATTAILGDATSYVSALARKQMQAAKDADATVAQLVSDLADFMNSPPTSATPDWMLSAIVAGAPEASEDERAAIIEAFNQYRLLEYEIAVKRNVFIENYLNHLKTYYALQSDPDNEVLKQADAAYWNAAAQAYAQVNAKIAERASKLQTLDDAISSLGGALRSAFGYLKTGEALIDKLMEKIGATFVAGYDAKVAADQTRKAEYLAEFVGENPAFIEEKIAPLVQQLEEMRAAVLPTSIEFPELPPATGSFSMSDLMRLLTRVMLLLQQLSRYVAEADTRIGSFNVASLLQELALERARSSAYKEWISIVNEADAAYNAEVNQDNKLAARETDATITFMMNYSAEIEEERLAINAEIGEWNTLVIDQGAALVAACEDIDQALIDEINAERRSMGEDVSYLDFFDFDPEMTPMDLEYTSISFSPIPLVESSAPDVETLHKQLTGYQEAIDDPTLLEDTAFCLAYDIPVGSTLQEVVSLINTNLEALLEKMAPALDKIKERLQAEWASDFPGEPIPDFDLRKLFMRELIDISQRPVPEYTETFIEQFTAAVLRVMEQSDIAEEERVSMNKFLDAIRKVYRERSLERERHETTAPGVSFGIAAVEFGPEAAGTSRLISRLAQTDILILTLSRTIEAAAILAGVVTAGGGVAGLASTMGISASELFGELGVDQTKFVGQQSTQALLFSFAEQLSIFAGMARGLQRNALNVLSQIPGAGKLTKDEVKEILAFLIMFQQLILFLLSMFMASQGGMSSAEFLTRVLGSSGGSAASMLNAFQALGLPQEKAIALGVALGGTATDLQNVLRSMGLDEGAVSVVLALIAAQQGNISLTQGVMGGPGYLDALIQRLKNAGIVITAKMGSVEFMQQLARGLELKADVQQRIILRAELKRIEEANAAKVAKEVSLKNLLDDLMKGIKADIEKARSGGLPPAAAHLAPLVRPSEILAQYVNEFRRFSAPVQGELLSLAQKKLGAISGISEEQKAALMIGVGLGRVSTTEAVTLAELARREALGTLSYSDMETKIISKLFKESPEARLAREEALKRAILNETERMKELLPVAFPQRVAENIRDSILRAVNNLEDKKLGVRIVERFSKFIEKLSDTAKVGVLLLNPALTPMVLFSPRLGTLPRGKGPGAETPPSLQV